MSARIPPDESRCQAEIREGSFMTLGPRSFVRCAARPVVVVTELDPGSDGECGSMSLCASCYEVLRKQGYRVSVRELKGDEHG